MTHEAWLKRLEALRHEVAGVRESMPKPKNPGYLEIPNTLRAIAQQLGECRLEWQQANKKARKASDEEQP